MQNAVLQLKGLGLFAWLADPTFWGNMGTEGPMNTLSTTHASVSVTRPVTKSATETHAPSAVGRKAFVVLHQRLRFRIDKTANLSAGHCRFLTNWWTVGGPNFLESAHVCRASDSRHLAEVV